MVSLVSLACLSPVRNAQSSNRPRQKGDCNRRPIEHLPTALNMATRRSGPAGPSARSKPDWAIQQEWETAQQAVWAVIGTMDAVMQSDTEIGERAPLQRLRPFVPGTPAHFRNPNITSCMACHGTIHHLTSQSLQSNSISVPFGAAQFPFDH